MKKKATNPTAGELEILNILWKEQPLTVKAIHELLAENKDVGYTTTLKIMQNMHAKGLLTRELQGKSHLYRAALLQEETQGRLLDRFLDATFSGSVSSLVMQLLGNRKTSQSELDEIKRLIESMENEKQHKA
ncbi:MAG: BlaI/MecI/CopY family transcriptional regulator [Prolixibacteraceae bacterium]|nr:BlaI/MecI/CopY family transcriptional regulator [Prolixibacteraceae bacterium]